MLFFPMDRCRKGARCLAQASQCRGSGILTQGGLIRVLTTSLSCLGLIRRKSIPPVSQISCLWPALVSRRGAAVSAWDAFPPPPPDHLPGEFLLDWWSLAIP